MDTLVLVDPDDQINPAMATDSDGHLWVAFQIYNPGNGKYGIGICESTDGGGTWDYDGANYGSVNYLNPDIAIDPYDNRVYIVYEVESAITGHDIEFGVYTPGSGSAWNYGIDWDSGDDRFPSITCDYDTGGLNYVYVSYEYVHSNDDRDLMFARSTDHGGTWTQTKLAGESNEPDSDSVYCETDITYADHTLYLAYRHSEDYTPLAGESDVWVHISNDYGFTWTQQQVHTDSDSPLTNPSIAATHGGDTVVVAYERLWSAGDHDILYKFSADSGTSWSGLHGLANTYDDEIQPSLTVDGCGSTSNSIYGNVHAVYWKGYYVWHRQAAYDDLLPAAWSTAQQVNDVDWASFSYPGIAITTQQRSGTWYPSVAWTDGRNPGYDIYYSTTADIVSPPVPTLLSPANGATTNDSTPSLEWTDVIDPSGVV